MHAPFAGWRRVARALPLLLLFAGGPSVAAQNVPPPLVTEAEAVRRALDAAPELLAAEAGRAAALGATRQADTRPNPTLGFMAENVAGTGAFEGLGGGEYELSVGQRIERGGKRTARRDLGEARQRVAETEIDQTRQALSLAVRAAYIDAAAAAARLDLATEQRRLAETLLDTVATRSERGRDSEAALLRSEALVLEAETAEALAEQTLAIAKAQLASYWPDGPLAFTVDPTALRQARLLALPTLEAVASNPDLLRRRALEREADAAIALTRANAKVDPTVALGVRRLEGAGGETAAMVSLSVPIPVFDRNAGAIAEARAERRRASALLRADTLALEREYRAARGAFETARAEADAIRTRIIPRAEAALAAARQGYERGGFTYLEVIEAQRALADLNAQEIGALTRLRQAEARLLRLTAADPAAPDGDH
jgi:cobalt-zinc-cadmium efflux system outer membrane protein